MNVVVHDRFDGFGSVMSSETALFTSQRSILPSASHSLTISFFCSITGGLGSTLAPMSHTAMPGAAKWTAVRNKNGAASLQDFIVSLDAATPGFAKTGAAPAPAPAAGAKEVPAVAGE